MSAETIKPTPAESSVADAVLELPQTLADQASVVARTVTDLTGEAVVTLARVTYTGAYFMAYAAVFSAVFVAQSLPRRNPVMEGFEDGGKAASDTLAKLERRKAGA
jgi:hypothetical protein